MIDELLYIISYNEYFPLFLKYYYAIYSVSGKWKCLDV